MPTWEALPRFFRDLETLSPGQRKAFRAAVSRFVADLKAGRGFRKGLRVKGIKGAEGIFEMTWADDGRATFQYGEAGAGNEPHVIWRRVGTHDVLEKP